MIIGGISANDLRVLLLAVPNLEQDYSDVRKLISLKKVNYYFQRSSLHLGMDYMSILFLSILPESWSLLVCKVS